MTSGYTGFIVQSLENPAVIVSDGTTKTVGGRGSLTVEIKDRCLTRMRAWVKLADLTVRTEYPDVDVLCAFEVFNVDAATIKDSSRGDQSAQFAMLARVCEVSVADLVQGYEFALPIAARKKKTAPHLSSLEAWKAAVDHVRSSRKLTSHVRALVGVLIRFAAWTGTSCGVERSFTMHQWAVEGRRAWTTDELENDELKLLCDRDQDQDEVISERARSIWTETGYGVARVEYKTRIDAGTKRKRTGNEVSEVAWIKRRRDKVSDVLREVGAQTAAREDLKEIRNNSTGWTAGHKKEEHHLMVRRMSEFVDALVDGTADPDQVNDVELCKLIIEEIERREVADKRRATERVRKDRAFKPGTRPELRGKSVFVSPEVDCAEDVLRLPLRNLGLRRVTDRTQADVFLEESMSQVGQRTAWCALMRGGLVVSNEFIISEGAKGAAIAYKAVLRSTKSVFCTQEFQDKHPVVYNILQVTSTQRGNKWRWLANLASVNDTAKKFKSKGRTSELVVFVGLREFRQKPAVLKRS
jgi:hypothetical protein